MGFAEYAGFDGVGLAGLVSRGEVAPAELVEATLEATAALLRALGHEVIERPLEIDDRALNAAWGPASAANVAAGMRRLIDVVLRSGTEGEGV